MINIAIQVGKSGALTPVAEMEPVLLAGTTVKRASLHNFEEVERKDVRVGDTVEIQKAGEIIPQVLRVINCAQKGRSRSPSQRNVECGGEVHKDPEGVYLRCLNLSCPAQGEGAAQHLPRAPRWTSKAWVQRRSSSLLGLVHGPADLYALTQDQVENLERMGKKVGSQSYRGRRSGKARPLSRLLNGLGIRHVGSHIAEVLASHFNSIDKLMDATVDELNDIHEIGGVVAASVHDFFRPKIAN